MASLLLTAALATCALSQSASGNTATVTAASSGSQASGLSQTIDPGFAGFGIEPSNLFSFTGGDFANDVSMQYLQNLADYSGSPPHIRVGGNTADYMMYDSSYDQYWIQTNQNANGQGAIASNSLTFGPKYFEAIDRMPTGTPITYGLNLAYEGSNYISNIVAEAAAALDNLKNVQVFSFEIGNEPDLYLQNGFRTGQWGGQEYVQEWQTRTAAIYEQVLQSRNISSDFFEPPATASTIGTTFTIADLVQDGILNKANGSDNSYVSGWNQHDYFYFIDVSTYAITLNYLMDLQNTESQFAYWASEIASSAKYNVPYNLREMASVGPTGITGISDVFGAALWQLNFFLYAATLNITSVGMHMVDGSYASPWQPDNETSNPPSATVRPPYYAFVAMDQLIGAANGTLQVASTTPSTVPSGYTGFVRTYAAYSNNTLMSLVLINAKPANASDSAKATLTLTVSLPSSFKGQTLYLSYLTATGADSSSGTTFNGLSFESPNSGGKPISVGDGKLQSTTVGSDGTAAIPVRDSEAVIATFGSLLGSNAVERVNGSSETSGGGKAQSSASLTLATTIATTAAAAAGSSTATNTGTGETASASASGTAKSAASGWREDPLRWVAMGTAGLAMWMMLHG
ncbi:MAG: hypothetical protein M1822_000102 [Bathelium mastoideum]|nr:MAG: hypothetical protein M1822_000102 [Bathelium mastoideum]